jgi:transaldolase
MQDKSILEKLVEMSPGTEIWWDSSPVIFENWCNKILAKADPANVKTIKAQIGRMYKPEDPMSQLFRGVTTNPPLSQQAIADNEPKWAAIGKEIIADNPGIETEELFWKLYKEVVRVGSEAYMPLFEASGYKEGYLSGQTDPRSVFDKDAMLKQALELAEINPNVMIKVPGSAQGYDVIEELTARGIPTNNTLTFILPQLMDCANTVKKGLEKAKANGVDLSKWRSVITHMESRYGDLGGLKEHAGGVEITESDIRHAELAIFRKAHRLLKERNLSSKMLSCSLRLGPTIDGKVNLWHLTEKTGANMVVTCPPSYIDQLIDFPDPESLVWEENRIEADIPKDVMDKLMGIEYFARAYDENGYTREEYNEHPALKKTADQFSKATWKMVDFAGSLLKK